MEPGTATVILVVGTIIFILAMVLLFLRARKQNAGKYPPPTPGKFFEIRRPPK